ncbi:hypothetical protein KKC60_02990 [Patescibacteria group bacterium]|nr:hypothetical protein [Patescibacteria group bacterium]
MDPTFYGSGNGNVLIDERKYPPEIKAWLKEETALLAKHAHLFNQLVEVGCMEGRFLAWALSGGKKYLGLDVVNSFIETGQEHCRSLKLPQEDYWIQFGDAEKLKEFSRPIQEKALLFFPFNSFGNIQEHLAAIRSLCAIKKPFLICSYATSEAAWQVRSRYYQNCNYSDLHWHSSEAGVTFSSSDGLNTTAYHPQYLVRKFEEFGQMEVQVIEFAQIGRAYLWTN